MVFHGEYGSRLRELVSELGGTAKPSKGGISKSVSLTAANVLSLLRLVTIEGY